MRPHLPQFIPFSRDEPTPDDVTSTLRLLPLPPNGSLPAIYFAEDALRQGAPASAFEYQHYFIAVP